MQGIKECRADGTFLATQPIFIRICYVLDCR